MSDEDDVRALDTPVAPTDWTDPQQLRAFSEDLEEVFRIVAERLLELATGIRECCASLEALDSRVTNLEAQAFRDNHGMPH